MRRTILAALGALVLGSGWGAGRAEAVELSHFSALPGMVFLDDWFLPPPEQGQFFYAQYSAYYGTDTFRDPDGNKVGQIQIEGPAGQPRTVDLSLDVDNWTIAPVLMWAPDWNVLGARYGVLAMLPVGNPTIAAGLQTEIGRGVEIEDSSWGLGDLFFQPIWLEWSRNRVDLSAGYGFYAPTGRYEQGATDNTGFGFWAHQLQSALRYRPNDTVAAVVSLSGEINQNKEDADIVPGSHLTMTWGARKHFFDDWLQFGVVGYDTWQVSNDSGSDVTRKDKDQVHGFGFQTGIPRLGLAVKYMHEFNARDRFEGDVVSIFFALPLDQMLRWASGA